MAFIVQVVLFFIAEKPVPTQYATPSSISKNWSFYQSEYKINFCCPPDQTTLNPDACVYFEPFADFIEQMKDGLHQNDPGSQFLDVANRLVYEMSQIFELEAMRQEQVIRILNPIRRFSSYTCKSSSKRAIQSDHIYRWSEKICNR